MIAKTFEKIMTVVAVNAVTVNGDSKGRHMATYIWVNTDSGNGLMPGGTKPLPEPILT